MAARESMRRHVYLDWEELCEKLGLEGNPIKVWVEPDADYVHVVIEWEGPKENAPEGFFWVTPHNYVDATTLG